MSNEKLTQPESLEVLKIEVKTLVDEISAMHSKVEYQDAIGDIRMDGNDILGISENDRHDRLGINVWYQGQLDFVGQQSEGDHLTYYRRMKIALSDLKKKIESPS